MSMKDGGPAFPTYCSGGMTLRDWFAGQYLVGVVSIPNVRVQKADWLAGEAYKMADAMLKAREGTS